LTDTLEVWLDGTGIDANIVLPKYTTTLFSFGCGTWSFNKSASGIPFIIVSDTQCISLVQPDGTKETNTVAAIMQKVSAKTGKTVKLAYHDKEQLLEDGALVANRYKFTLRKDVHYCPDAVDVTARNAEGKPLTMIEFGAAFIGKFCSMPSKHATIMFECELVPSATDPTTITLRPTLPKLIMTTDFAIEKGKFVRVC
jgi:hypothetical protein